MTIDRDVERLRRIQEFPKGDVERTVLLLQPLDRVIFWNMYAPRGIFILAPFSFILATIILANSWMYTQINILIERYQEPTFVIGGWFALVFLGVAFFYIALVDWRSRIAFKTLKDIVLSDTALRITLQRLMNIEPDPYIARYLKEVSDFVFAPHS